MSSPIRPLLAGLGLLLAGVTAAFPVIGQEQPFQFEYDLAQSGWVTWVIEDASGRRVRNLLSGAARPAGHHREIWDRKDDRGRTVRGKKFRARGLHHTGFDLRYEFSFGNPGNPPWPTPEGDGSWLADHGDPLDVLADGGRVYLSAVHAEGPSPLIALDGEANKLWGTLDREYAGFLARSGNYIYVAVNRGMESARSREHLDMPAVISLTRVDAASGAQVPFPGGERWQRLAEVDLRRGRARTHEGAATENGQLDAHWIGDAVQGLAAFRGQLYVASFLSNELLQVDPGTGRLVGRIPVEAPSALAADDKGLLVASGRAIVRLDPRTGAQHTIVSSHLAAPVGLAVDAEQRIYVADWGDQMCVKVFSPAGHLLKVIGRPGGRARLGPYEREGMLFPRGIAVDPDGRLWVAENDSSPRRLSVWSVASGRLLLERLGQTRYGGQGTWVFPDEPQQAWLTGNVLDLDWQRGRWRVAGTPWRPTRAADLLGLDARAEISRVVKLDGRRFIVHSNGGRAAGGAVVVSEWREDRAHPVAAMGTALGAILHPSRGAGMNPPSLFAEQLWRDPALNRAARRVLPWWFDGPRAGDYRAPTKELATVRQGLPAIGEPHAPNTNFIFTDENGNGATEPSEVRFFPAAYRGSAVRPLQAEPWSHGVADDTLALYFTRIDDGWARHYRFPVASWTASGAPVYDPDRAERVAQGRHLGRAAWVSADRHLLTYGDFKRSGRSEREPLVMYRPDGTVAWTYPSPYTGVHGSHSAPAPRAGVLMGPLGVIGAAHIEGLGELFGLHTNFGQVELFTADGLYLGALFQDVRTPHAGRPAQPRRGESMQRMSNGAEWFGGQLFQHSGSGAVYVVGGRTSADIALVQGLDEVQRLAPVDLVAAAPRGQTAAPQAAAPAGAAPRLAIRPLPNGAGPPRELDEHAWGAGSAAHWESGAQREAQATWTFDARNLYLAFRSVKDQTPFENAGADPALLHTTGDALMLELQRRGGERGEGGEDGFRIVVAPHAGRPIAVLTEARAGVGGRRIDTPAALGRLGRTRVLEDAEISVTREDGEYGVAVAIPLESLAFSPRPGSYRGDFGVIYGAAEPGAVSLRMHWANRDTGLVSDVVGQDRMTPERWGWFDLAGPGR